MAQPKRATKVSSKNTKKQTNAKQAFKKKQHSANKSRNDDLREKLDREASSLLNLQAVSNARPNQKQQPTASIDTFVNSLTNRLNNL
ncbi:hypothetical protein CPC08DRAFT_702667 [Agrocybe pediades]|nr:hypothetical protein CPC08DRAFT_702667 [Agrocybe pediades]